MKNNKNILLSGFNKKELSDFKKKFKNLTFFEYENFKNSKIIFSAFVSKDRKSFETFYNNDYKKIKSHLSWLHVSASGIDNYPKILKKTKFTLTNSKIIQGPEVADHVFALLLSLTRNLNLTIKFGHKVKFLKRPIELKDKKILIIGFGGIGRCVSERAKGFGMNISALNLNPCKVPNYVKKLYSFKQYKKALSDKDVVIYSVPLTKKTKKMYNSKVSKYFKKGAILINVSRGEVVCEKTLYKNLKNNYLSGAGLDVFAKNNKINKKSKFNKLKNFVFTPHIASISDNFIIRNDKLIKDNLKNFSKNKKLKNVIIKKNLI